MDYNSYDRDFWSALEQLVAESDIVVDRPRGSNHPRYPEAIYPVDYGYLKNTKSMDGGGIDVWKGSGNKGDITAVMCIVDLVKRDSEIKILIGCSDEETESIYQFHNKSSLMKGILVTK